MQPARETTLNTPDTAKFNERTARLRSLLALNAPSVIIAREAQLVCEAYDGGPWRHALRSVARAFGETWYWHVVVPFGYPVLRLLCRHDIWHMEQGEGGLGCPFCGKGDEEGPVL